MALETEACRKLLSELSQDVQRARSILREGGEDGPTVLNDWLLSEECESYLSQMTFLNDPTPMQTLNYFSIFRMKTEDPVTGARLLDFVNLKRTGEFTISEYLDEPIRILREGPANPYSY